MKTYSLLKQCLLSGVVFSFSMSAAAQVEPDPVPPLEVAQTPLFVGIHVPGNLVLVPSVEWPTINSVANIGEYTPEEEFVGYFDSGKCYTYNYSDDESQRHFNPAGSASGRTCSGQGQWSGNFLNWAATQTVDPFRKALTGGYRVVDTPTSTWLEKARHDGQGGTGIYPNRSLIGAELVSGATPFNSQEFHTRVSRLGNRMAFSFDANLLDDIEEEGTPPALPPLSAYIPGGGVDDDEAYHLAVRVAVCVFGRLEPNCVEYEQGWKPEGLIQRYANRLRYSIFGYLNHSSFWRDGGVLRARQKHLGSVFPNSGATNPGAEWDPDTGVLIQNPNPAEAQETSDEFGTNISHSGVINYLNRFGQMTDADHKSFDPNSELFYTAVRYIRGAGNVPAYSDMSGANSATSFQYADGFPVITDWYADGHDPVLHECQVNVALGIGDIYTHRDKNLPGNTSGFEEPTKPAQVSGDNWVDVVNATNRVGNLEGLGNIGNSGDEWTGRRNSAFLAGLAYWANTTDMRPDDERPDKPKVTMSSHWIDVLEAQSLEGIARNQYVLAAKYGGARVPDDFNPMTDSLENDWWWANGETLEPFGPRHCRGNPLVCDPPFQRPDNFYTAGRAADMVASLTEAFTNIIRETGGDTAALATSATRLDSESLIIEAVFESGFWSGDVLAFDPFEFSGDPTDPPEPEWRASDGLQAGTCGGRSIFTADDGGGGLRFNTDMDPDLKQRIMNGADFADEVDEADLINYLCGVRTNEANNPDDPQEGEFRKRGASVLGDIVNSNIVFSGAENEGWASAFSDYVDFLSTTKQSRGEWVFVGANDGMLHAFDAENNGSEAFAYIPHEVLPRLARLADPDYTHQFYVDGGIAVADARFGNNDWRTVLVGTLGAGGRAVYALDVTNPGSFGAGNVLWEISADDYPELGFTFGRPQIARLGDANGTPVAIFGNGYGSEVPDDRNNPEAALFVVNLQTGQPISGGIVKPEPGNSDSGLSLGLSSPSIWWDTATRSHVSRVYAGDLAGNMWRFDFGPGPSMGLEGQPLFSTEGQPITTGPALAAHPAGGLMIYVGTGKLFENRDLSVSSDDPIDTFYALRDRNSPINLGGMAEIEMGEIELGEGVARTFDGEADPDDDGWYVEMTVTAGNVGERVLNRAQVIFGRVFFTSFEPVLSQCLPGGTPRFYGLDALSGRAALDLTGDCPNCGGIVIGDATSSPIDPPIAIRRPPSIGDPGSPGGPGTPSPGDPPPLPDPDSPIADVAEWCDEQVVIHQGFNVIGTICVGRQVWREIR